MKRFIYLLTALLIFTYGTVKSETFETNYNHYSAFAADEENFYIGLHNGFVVQNIESGEATYYNSTNSNLGTNYIGEIVINKGTVYITGPGGMFTYSDGNFIKIELGSNGARKLHFIEDDIWTFDARSIYRYDGVYTQKYDITKYINSSYEIARIDVHNNHIWISMYSITGRWEDYYSNLQYKTFRFASYNLETNDLITFTEQERGFDDMNTISFQAVSNNEVWVAIGASKCYIYDLESAKWRRNEHLDLIPAGYELKYWDGIVDLNGDVWVSLKNKYSDGIVGLMAVYSYKTNTFTIKFEDEIKERFNEIYNYYLLGDNILVTGSKEHYVINGDSLYTIKKTDFPEDILSSRTIVKVKDDFYSLAYSENDTDKIINISSKEKFNYGLNGKSQLPIPAFDAYLKDNNTKLIIGGETVNREYDDLIFQKGEWIRTRDFGINNSFYEETYDRFSNGDLVVKVYNKIYALSDTVAKEYNNIRNDSNVRVDFRDFKIFEDKIFIYGFYETSDYVFDSFISVLDKENKELFQYNKDNSCLPSFTKEGGFIFSYVDSVPMQIEIDNHGNIWALTKRSLFKIDENLNCEYVDYLPFRDGRYPSLYMSNLAYSKNEEVLFGSSDNAIYNLDSPNLDNLNLSEHGLGTIKYFGACSDGNVYLTTETGGLYRVKNIRELIPIEIVSGKEELGVPINHVSYFKDTLYVSTDVGLYKVHSPLTSVENGGKELSSNLFFPNPSSDYINIEATNQPVTISSMTGRVMKQVTGETRIDISFLHSGVYFVRIGDKIQKLVKY